MGYHTMLHALFGFNQAMNERLWIIIMEHLSDDQFVRTDGYSRGSIRNQLVHMADAQYYWLRGLLDMGDLPKLDAEEYPDREAARTVCQQADQISLTRVRGLSKSDLERIPDGWILPVWVGLLQNAHHSTDHRAQVLRALHDLGAPTFEQSFVNYMESVTPMSVQDVIGFIGAKRSEWDDLLRQVPAGQMNEPCRAPGRRGALTVRGALTIRDAVAIVTWKERRVVEIIRNRFVTEVSFGQLPEAEQASILEASRALPLAALLEQHRLAHREMLDTIRELSEADLNAEDIEGLPPDERLWKVIGGATWWSYPALSGPLRQWLQENASNPPL
jgi:uncharacterized damage-inducible protein DinB